VHEISVREIVRQHYRFFLIATLAALAVRLLFFSRFPALTADSFVYGDIAKNWLQHGIYGVTSPQGITPTLIRLPGYPAFLAAVFAIFGMEHYRAALGVQILVDLGSCFLIADLARRVVSERAGRAAFLLAALCPFLANYAAAALTETLEIFFTVVALDFAAAGLESIGSTRLSPWVGCGLAVGTAIVLRPDGGLLLIAIWLGLILLLLPGWIGKTRAGAPALHLSHVLRAGLIVGIIALAPLVPWTLRNQHALHQFQPLAPRYANEGNEFIPLGFNRWVKTWIVDYASVEEIYWAVPGEAIDASKLPTRAFDSDAQRERTEHLITDYNRALHVTPDLDMRFASLAAQRISDKPLRYYLWLPMIRIADMWLRPRTELLPSDTRWWEFDDDPKWSMLAVALGVVGMLYLAAAFAGLARTKFTGVLALLLAFVILRSVFLGTLENPEPRYTLECYPVVIVLAAAFFAGSERRQENKL
jgi:4-amino-4-deoxy-L-arabinose transferase-like glycosyltransferase